MADEEVKEDRGDEFTPDEETEEQQQQQQPDKSTEEQQSEESKEDFMDRLADMTEEEADAELERLQSLGKLEEYFPDEGEQEPEEQPKTPMIPKSRFDEALAKERARTAALEARLEAMERQQQQAPQQPQGPTIEQQMAEVRKQKIEAMKDEDWGKVAELEAEHEELMEKKFSSRAEKLAAEKAREAGETVSQQSLQEKLNEVSDQIVGRHPELAEDTDAAKEHIESFEAWRDYYITKKKLSPVKAMLEAEKKIFPEQKKPASDPDALRKAILKRREDALKKKIRTNEAQPPRAKGRGHGDSALAKDVAKMSDEEFSKLTPKELAELRGDIVTEEA